jgi:hypothetical protein
MIHKDISAPWAKEDSYEKNDTFIASAMDS